MLPFHLKLPRFGSDRFVILIGDDGAMLVHMSGKQVRRTSFAAAPTQDEARKLLEALSLAPNAGITLLLDTVEQQFREADIPNVGPLDRAKIVSRRLGLTFPEDHLTGAQAYSHGNERERKYMFAAVPYGGDIKSWFSILAQADNPIDGVTVLPAEAVPLVSDLRSITQKSGASPAEDPAKTKTWQLLLTQQRCSGFRQTIIQHGRLVFTRLTPQLDPSRNTESLIENIEHEFASTVGYLRRLSYSDADRVELFIIAEPRVCRQLTRERLKVKALTAVTPHDIAQEFGFGPIIDPNDGYSDILYAAWASRRRKPQIDLSTSDMRKAALYHRVPSLAAVSGLAIGLVGVASASFSGLTWLELQKEQSALSARVSDAEQQQQALSEQFGSLPIDPLQIEASLSTYQDFTQTLPRIDNLLARIANTLGAEAQVMSLNAAPDNAEQSFAYKYYRQQQPQLRRRGQTSTQTNEVVIALRVQLTGPFRNRTQITDGFEALVGRLEDALPEYSVNIKRDPLVGRSGAGFKGVAGLSVDNSRSRLPLFVDSEIEIRGPATES